MLFCKEDLSTMNADACTETSPIVYSLRNVNGKEGNIKEREEYLFNKVIVGPFIPSHYDPKLLPFF